MQEMDVPLVSQCSVKLLVMLYLCETCFPLSSHVALISASVLMMIVERLCHHHRSRPSSVLLATLCNNYHTDIPEINNKNFQIQSRTSLNLQM